MTTPQGYDFDFVDKLADDCICKICHLALRQPVQTRCCGHRFCKDCLVEATKRQSECPLDRKPLNIEKDVFDDKAAERTVKSLRITCPRRCKGCPWQGELANVKVHDKKCDYMIVPCTFQRSGCDFKTQRKNMEEHLEKKIKEHLVLTQDENEKLKKTLAQIKEQVGRCTNKFIWKINNFTDDLEKAKQPGEGHLMYSDPLYTDKYGYKMRVILYPNGDRDDATGHVSIFIQLLRGEYDAVLPWPFARKITITLLDQKEDLQERKNVEKTTSYKGMLNNSEAFNRPTTDSNTGLGYKKFISHEELMTENYIVDDTIFLQVEVGEEYTGTE
ncbi:TNF receptor-associated factor 6-B-like [Actinia tenebrosa]|uniref:TNF receptor-associated factor 6-B-like n=1 Tax=Actinia tenebrosa TaxID=6105 RepID=A0A6P8H3Y9_ACTTE|nr:TNF receptor-associated factor 6-B-like [Actinia tenebrosa]